MKKRVVAAAAATVVVAIGAGSASAAEVPVLFAETGTGSAPSSLATDPSGSVFVLRSSPAAITKITSAGASTAAWATPPSGRYWSSVIAAPGGALYASSDTGSNPFIWKLAADGSVAQAYSTAGNAPRSIAVDASGNIFYVTSGGSNEVGRITVGGVAETPVALGFQPSTAAAVAVDAAGNVYVAGRNTSGSPGASRLVRFSNDLSTSHDYNVNYGSANGCILTAREQYAYCAHDVVGATSARVARIEGLTFDSTWATIPGTGMSSPEPKALQAGSDGYLYVGSGISGGAGQTGVVSKISPTGATAELAATAWVPRGLAVDPSTNVFVSNQGSMGPGPSAPVGVYKITQASPTPTPAPTPAPGPAPAPAPTPTASAIKTPTVNAAAPGQNAVVTVAVKLAEKGQYTFIFERPTSNEMSREQASSNRVPMQKGTKIGKRRLAKAYTAAVITTTADNAKVVTNALIKKAQVKKLNLRVVFAPSGAAKSESVIKIK